MIRHDATPNRPEYGTSVVPVSKHMIAYDAMPLAYDGTEHSDSEVSESDYPLEEHDDLKVSQAFMPPGMPSPEPLLHHRDHPLVGGHCCNGGHVGGNFWLPPLDDHTDFLDDSEVLEARKGRDIVTAAHSGDPVKLRWPFPLVSHEAPFQVQVEYRFHGARLASILDAATKAQIPVPLTPNADNIHQTLKNHPRFPGATSDVRFVMHSAAVVEYETKGVPVSLCLRLESSERKDFCVNDRVCATPGYGDVAPFTLFPETCKRVKNAHLCSNNAKLLGSAKWMRWASLNPQHVLANLQTHVVDQSLFYQFVFKADDPVARHPVAHIILLNLPRLLKTALRNQVYHGLTLEEMVRLDPTTNDVILTAPCGPVDTMIKETLKDVSRARSTMDLSTTKLFVFPTQDNGFDVIRKFMEDRQLSMAYVRNPQVSLRVVVAYTAVFAHSILASELL